MHTGDIQLERYSNFRPTQFDSKGLGLEDRQDWLLAPVSQTRDSEPLEVSNFRTVLRDLEGADPEGENHEVHRFGHWGPGWFEVILVRPDSDCHLKAQEWTAALESYPVADDTDFYELEAEEAEEAWRYTSMRERIRLCAKAGVSIFASRDEYPPHDDNGAIQQYLLGH